MNDTDSRITAMAAELHGRMAPEERLRIASAMFDDARTIVEASLPHDLPLADRRLALARRLYDRELPEAALRAFARWPNR